MAAGMLAFLAVTAGASSGILITVLNSQTDEQKRIDLLQTQVEGLVKKARAQDDVNGLVKKYFEEH